MKLDNVNKIAKGLLSVMSHRRTLRLLLTLYTDIYIIPFLSNVKLHHVLLILTYLKFEEKIVNFTCTPIYIRSNENIYVLDQNMFCLMNIFIND